MRFSFLETEVFGKNIAYYDAAAEMGLLGCVLLAGTVKSMEGVQADVFFGEKAYCTARAMQLCRDKLDMVLLHGALKKLYPEQAPQLMQWVMAASDQAVSLVNLGEYRRIVLACARRRGLYSLLQRNAEELGRAELDPDVIVGTVQQELRYSRISEAKWASSFDVAARTMAYLEDVSSGKIRPIRTGLPGLDEAIGGFYRGELSIIGARPAVGKSAFANHIAIEAARQGKRVCVCSREMSDVQYGQRLLSAVGGIEGRKLRLGVDAEDDETWKRIGESANVISQLPVDYLFSVSMIEDLRSEVSRKAAQGECDLLIVDYLQLMRTKRNFDLDHLRVGYISKILKDMTLDLNIPIIALAQVKRSAPGSSAKMPTLDELKDSGSIEQDADGVIFLHRPESAEDVHIKPKDKAVFTRTRERSLGLQFICVGIAKQRQGQTGSIGLVFNPNMMHYVEAEKLR